MIFIWSRIIIYNMLKEIWDIISYSIVICSEHSVIVKCHIRGMCYSWNPLNWSEIEWIWNSYYTEENFGHVIVLRFLLQKIILAFKNMNSYNLIVSYLQVAFTEGNCWGCRTSICGVTFLLGRRKSQQGGKV